MTHLNDVEHHLGVVITVDLTEVIRRAVSGGFCTAGISHVISHWMSHGMSHGVSNGCPMDDIGCPMICPMDMGRGRAGAQANNAPCKTDS